MHNLDHKSEIKYKQEINVNAYKKDIVARLTRSYINVIVNTY